jgi:NADPH-dependent curcumin reductase CurA
MVQNKSLVLAKNPVGLPVPGSDLTIVSSDFDFSAPPPAGGLIVKTNYLSFDPYQRGRMNPGTTLYTTGYSLNSPITNNAISTVISSSNPRFKTGDVILGNADFSEYQVIPKERADLEQSPGGGNAGISLLKNPLGLDPMSFLGALGMSGLTAYSSLYEIGKPKKGEVIFISAASGAVGQIVGQLAKREGLKVIGSVGSDEKLKFITEELGFDAGFNYKKEDPVEGLMRILGDLGEQGLNIYYDNVGGEQLDAALFALSTGGRIGMSLPLISPVEELLIGSSIVRQRIANQQKTRRNPWHPEHAHGCPQEIDD